MLPVMKTKSTAHDIGNLNRDVIPYRLTAATRIWESLRDKDVKMAVALFKASRFAVGYCIGWHELIGRCGLTMYLALLP